MVNKQAGRVMYLLLSVIFFHGQPWIALNPSTGYLLMQGFYGSGGQSYDN